MNGPNVPAYVVALAGRCVLCGRGLPGEPGLAPVAGLPRACGECSRRHGPALAALRELVGAARRVARASPDRPLWVSLELLLELSYAAESYAVAVSRGDEA